MDRRTGRKPRQVKQPVPLPNHAVQVATEEAKIAGVPLAPPPDEPKPEVPLKPKKVVPVLKPELQKYMDSLQKRINVPYEVKSKMLRAASKGEAKRLLAAYLRDNNYVEESGHKITSEWRVDKLLDDIQAKKVYAALTPNS